MEEEKRKLWTAVLLGFWVYGLILWAYIVADSFIFPIYQFMSISKYIPIPQNILADVAFPISFVCFIAWAYLRSQQNY